MASPDLGDACAQEMGARLSGGSGLADFEEQGEAMGDFEPLNDGIAGAGQMLEQVNDFVWENASPGRRCRPRAGLGTTGQFDRADDQRRRVKGRLAAAHVQIANAAEVGGLNQPRKSPAGL
jgi:hypothetical protein